MLKLLGVAWSVWKITAKRFGYAGRIVITVLALIGFVLVKQMLRERYPAAADALDQLA